MERIAILGLGIMGSGLARNLLAAGAPVTVWNRSPVRRESFANTDARIATSVGDAVAESRVVQVMVADDEASRAIWLGEGGVLEYAQPDTLLIESSTVSPGWIEELAVACAARGIEFVEAPVAGSKPQVESGELIFLVGGTEENLERARPYLAPSGTRILHVGAHGMGARTKLFINLVMGMQVAGIAEGIRWAQAAGVPADIIATLTHQSAIASPIVATVSERILAQDFATRFPLYLQEKDLRYACAEAIELGLNLPLATATQAAFAHALAQGKGQADIAAIADLP